MRENDDRSGFERCRFSSEIAQVFERLEESENCGGGTALGLRAGMSKFLNHTIEDMRGGRDSWRVLLTFAVPSFVIAFAAAIV